jgi:LmbE family N-acetylglucosaminyl deacetylase
MSSASLLAVFAHPDDEAFGTGGTLARYAIGGVTVSLVCATRGEVGEVWDPSLATPDNLGEVRENELRQAAAALGISELVFLGYRDSGMAGSPQNSDPRSLAQARDEDVIRQLVAIIRRTKPLVVITFEPGGGYGHPDHIAISRQTVAAFHAAADSNVSPEAGKAWQASRLFFTAIPRGFFVEMKRRMEELGIDTTEFARFAVEPLGWPDDQIHCTVDVADFVESKWWAIHSHMTQFGPGNIMRRLPESVVKQMMSREYFALAWPEPEPGLCLEDLLEGLEQ